MRIGIVNDLRLAVETLRRAVATIPGAEVAWIAEDGAQAVRRCAEDRPDIVLMDMIMPVMDGVEATRRIMAESPCPILVVTATVEGNAGRVFEALGAGALDAVATPGLAADGGVVNAEPLVRKIRAIGLIAGPARAGPHGPHATSGSHRGGASVPPLVAIGASTGGPLALAVILRALPRPAPWPIVVVQHIDAGFARGLCDWLSAETGQAVEAIADGASPAAGRVLVAATGDHLVLEAGGGLRYTQQPLELVFRPSVDVFFGSLADAAAPRGVAVVLTGMGRDGAEGMARLRAGGWHTIAQDRATSVVWGMPGACVEAGAAVQALAIGEIGRAIAERMPAPLKASGGGAGGPGPRGSSSSTGQAPSSTP